MSGDAVNGAVHGDGGTTDEVDGAAAHQSAPMQQTTPPVSPSPSPRSRRRGESDGVNFLRMDIDGAADAAVQEDLLAVLSRLPGLAPAVVVT